MAGGASGQPQRGPCDHAELLAAVVDGSADAIISIDRDQRITLFNKGAEEIFGYEAHQALGQPLELLLPVGVADVHRHHVEEFARSAVSSLRMSERAEVRGRRADGTEFPAAASISHAVIHGEPVCTVILRDMTAQLQAEKTLREAEVRRGAAASEARLAAIVASSTDAIFSKTLDGTITSWNAAAERLYGYAEADVVGTNVLALYPRGREHELVDILQRVGRGEAVESFETERRHADGRVVPVSLSISPIRDAGRVVGASTIARDVSARKLVEQRIFHQAFHDPLTALPNRLLLTDRLVGALSRVTRSGQMVGVLFVDLDRFKVINDTRGHNFGDIVLVDVAHRLREALRPSDTVARFGGDEFVVVVEGAADLSEVMRVAERVEKLFAEPFRLPGGYTLHVSASIGIAVAGPSNPPSPDRLLGDADAAMYQAKERGRGRIEVFDDAMRNLAERRLDLEGALHGALGREEFRLVYQPIVAPGGAPIVGAEALLRWDSAHVGLQQPGSFIPLAEDTGLIVDIGAWVLAEACQQLQRWHRALPGLREFTMAVNLSPVQLGPALVERVGEVLDLTATDPASITLELTESVLMEGARHLGVLEDLKATGVRLAIDDFGVGYSSLSYLKRFPVDVLKIDRSFIDGLGTDPHDATIVSAITTMADGFGVDVVAEGVETAAQANTLHSLGRAQAQGFYYGKPMTPDDLASRITNGNARCARA